MALDSPLALAAGSAYPLPYQSRTDFVVTATLFFLGAFLSFPYLFTTSLGPKAMALLAAAWTGLFVAAQRGPSRLVRSIAAAGAVLLYIGSIYGALLFIIVLGWSLPAWAIILTTVTSLAAVVTARRGWRRFRVPAVLPLGVLITTTLLGWWSEGGRVRCDDFLRLQRESNVTLIIPSLQQLPACQPGVTLPLGRYPRQIWEGADRKTLVFTTQEEPYANQTNDGFGGAICSAEPDRGRMRCIGTGKGEHLIEVPPDRLVVMTRDSEGGALYAFARNDVFGNATVIRIPRAGTGFYDPTLDVLYVIGDDSTVMTPVRGADLNPAAPVPLQALIVTDIGPYDDQRHLGILCGGAGPLGAILNGGQSYLATKFHATPFRLERIGNPLLSWFAFSFGCDWDRASGRVFVALPNLGAVADVDVDTGRLLTINPADIGLRLLRFDSQRRRIYAGDFLRGYVVELDVTTKRTLRRWFVGHFTRDIHLTRDGQSLLVASNLGVVRISL